MQPPSTDRIDVVVITVPRTTEYIHGLLGVLSADLCPRIVVGAPESTYLDRYRQNPSTEIVQLSPEEWAQFKDRPLHHRASWNYWRSLILGPHTPAPPGLVVFEDDIILARDWLDRLNRSIKSIEAEFGDRYVLTLYAAERRLVVHGPNALYAQYPVRLFFGTQAVYYPEGVRSGFSEYLKENGVNCYRLPYDLILAEESFPAVRNHTFPGAACRRTQHWPRAPSSGPLLCRVTLALLFSGPGGSNNLTRRTIGQAPQPAFDLRQKRNSRTRRMTNSPFDILSPR